MARHTHTPEQLEAIAADLDGAATAIREIAKSIRASGMPHALIHGMTIKTVYVPEVLDWIGKAKADADSQIRAFHLDVQSKAELHKKQAEYQKTVAAKKPWKKAPKKKT